MNLIIDGYNLLALDKRLDRGLEQSRNSLIKKLVRYQHAKKLNLTVVFDGWRSGSANEQHLHEDGIQIIYSRLGEKADAVVIRAARENSSDAVVVSSDREIRNAVERFGAVAIHSDEFNNILQDLDLPSEEHGYDDFHNRPSSHNGGNRLAKSARKRQEKLRKLRL